MADTLDPIAEAVGQAWAHELADTLRIADREIVGAWPGTVAEARMRIRSIVRTRLELDQLERLAHVAYGAARRGWQLISEPDPES